MDGRGERIRTGPFLLGLLAVGVFVAALVLIWPHLTPVGGAIGAVVGVTFFWRPPLVRIARLWEPRDDGTAVTRGEPGCASPAGDLPVR